MRGKNIRLQHQDHVKQALITPRQVQSAACPVINRPMSLLHSTNEHSSKTLNPNVSLPLRSGRTSRNLLRNLTPTPKTRSHFAFTTSAKKREWLGDKHAEPYGEIHQKPDLNQSIVVKIPHLTKYHR